MSEHFPYHYDFRFAPMWLGVGVLPWRDGVTITDDDRLIATFGIFRVDTPLSNIADAHVTEATAGGPRSAPAYPWPTTDSPSEPTIAPGPASTSTTRFTASSVFAITPL